MYLHPSVSTDKLLAMLRELRAAETEVHQFSMYCKGEKMVEFSPAPYCCKDKRRVNSVSKGFVSTAVGLCYDRGLLKPEDKLIDFFPEELTKDADEKIKALTLHQMLTMNTGVEDVIALLTQSDDPVKTFFTHTFAPSAPGFQYNNASTFMLSALVTRLTGLTVLDLLYQEIFPTLGITGVSWPSLNGISEGCAGLRICADDLARHMQIYLEGGTYHGKRLLSEEWVKLATTPHMPTDKDNDLAWWSCGYGYKFWMDKPEGFRATGALGQYGHVFPSLQVVLGVESKVGKHDRTQDAYYAFCSDFTGASTVSVEELEAYIHAMYPPLKGDASDFGGYDTRYRMEKNDMGLTLVTLRKTDGAVEMELSEGEYLQTLRFGVGHWVENKVFLHNFRPELYHLTRPRREIVHFAASCATNEKGELEVFLRFRDCAFRYNMTIAAGEEISIAFDTTYLTPGALCLRGKRIGAE